jgi:hypothetical protein
MSGRGAPPIEIGVAPTVIAPRAARPAAATAGPRLARPAASELLGLLEKERHRPIRPDPPPVPLGRRHVGPPRHPAHRRVRRVAVMHLCQHPPAVPRVMSGGDGPDPGFPDKPRDSERQECPRTDFTTKNTSASTDPSGRYLNQARWMEGASCLQAGSACQAGEPSRRVPAAVRAPRRELP